MSDMRLIVAGAGGRMGRTLVKAITDTDGTMLAGALEADGQHEMALSFRLRCRAAAFGVFRSGTARRV